MSSLLSRFPSMKLRSRDSKLRSGKRLRFSSANCVRWMTEGSSSKRQAAGAPVTDEEEVDSDSTACSGAPEPSQARAHEPAASKSPTFHFDTLPDELLDGTIADALGLQDLCAFAQVCKKFRTIATRDERWRLFFESRWGKPNGTVVKASKLAGSWRQLFIAKQAVETEAAPWVKPTTYEIAAAVEGIAVQALALPETSAVQDGSAQPSNLARSVLFLVDGSGSVTEDDFLNMTGFMQQAWHGISTVCSNAKVGIVQFSNDVRVELQPVSMSSDHFQAHVTKMTRMNGGTNISAAIRKAGQLLGVRPPPPLGSSLSRMREIPATLYLTRLRAPCCWQGIKGEGGHSAIILLTDGRVDGYQASEAVEMAGRLVDEVSSSVSLYAFGVGRGVDKAELLRIVGAGGPKPDDSHYLGLCTYEDAPW
mmetsp:Transcript_41729/g.106789  ORF Transcript_41729/g.106789 Transcript_41729/m.106789 type:complete len:422 (+) Transcript_41729:207-1472(+)